MATGFNDNKLKKCNVISNDRKDKCKRINMNGVKVWSAESDLFETATLVWAGKTNRKSGGEDGGFSVAAAAPYLSCNAGEKAVTFCYTKEKIDFSDYEKLTVTVTMKGAATGYTTRGGVFMAYSDYTDIGFDYGSTNGIYNIGMIASNNPVKDFFFKEACPEEVTETRTYDISGINGKHYLLIGVFRGEIDTYAYLKASRMILE